MHVLTANVHSTLTLSALLGNALFLQTTALFERIGWGVPTFGSNGPLWSLCNEFWYYIAFPLLVLFFTRGRSWRMRSVCLLGLAAIGWLVGAQIAVLGITWLMGVSIGSLPPVPARNKGARGWAIASSLALLAAGLVLDKKLNSLSGDLLLGTAVTLLIWVTLHCATAPLPSSYVRVARRAAHSSYTLYLVHLPMLIFLKASLHLPRALPGWHMWLVSSGIVALILLYAQIVYELFEKHTDRVRRWLQPFVLGRSAA